MKTPGTLVMLPTEKASRIHLDLKLNLDDVESLGTGNQHLYLTSDEEIKEGDRYLNGKHLYQADRHYERAVNDKKVIATTDDILTHYNDKTREGRESLLPQIQPYQAKWMIEYYNLNKKFPPVVFDVMETPISIFQSEEQELEHSVAGIMITLRNSTIQVISMTPEKELLHEIINAPKGSWDKIWECIKSIKSVK